MVYSSSEEVLLMVFNSVPQLKVSVIMLWLHLSSLPVNSSICLNKYGTLLNYLLFSSSVKIAPIPLLPLLLTATSINLSTLSLNQLVRELLPSELELLVLHSSILEEFTIAIQTLTTHSIKVNKLVSLFRFSSTGPSEKLLLIRRYKLNVIL